MVLTLYIFPPISCDLAITFCCRLSVPEMYAVKDGWDEWCTEYADIKLTQMQTLSCGVFAIWISKELMYQTHEICLRKICFKHSLKLWERFMNLWYNFWTSFCFWVSLYKSYNKSQCISFHYILFHWVERFNDAFDVFMKYICHHDPFLCAVIYRVLYKSLIYNDLCVYKCYNRLYN